MLKNTVVEQYNVNLIDYNSIFCETVSPIIIDELYDLKLIIDDRLDYNSTVNRAISHHVITSVCETVLNINGTGEIPVFCCCTKCLDGSELNNYVSDKSIGSIIINVFDELRKLIGVSCLSLEFGYVKCWHKKYP